VSRSLQDAYVAGDAAAFYPSHFASETARRAAVDAAVRPLASEVARVLFAQNARYAPSPARDANLQALRDGAAAVVTGQQVGLLLGPLFTIYKAATAIVAARALAAESGKPVVPVFWLQTEDHDLREIASTHAPTSAGGTLTLSLPVPEDARVSVSACALPSEIEACLHALDAELSHFPNAAPHLARLRRHYHTGSSYGAAFAGLLAELFADQGLVLVDPRDPELSPIIAHVHRRALTDHTALATALTERSAALKAQGFDEGVHVRADATLSFFHAGGPEAPRARLRALGDRFFDGDRAYTLLELLATLERSPLSFSTSALLRPLVQDTLLPTAMYVGGPAEVAYFAQLAPLYAAFGLRMPIVLPRARFVVVDDKLRKLLTRLDISVHDAGLDEEALLAKLAARDPALETAEQLAQRLGDTLCATLDAELTSLGMLAPEVQASAEKTRASLRTSAEKLAHKHARSRAHADEARVTDVRRVRHWLYPQAAPQERIYGLSYYAARFGEQEFLGRVLAGVQPFDPKLRELTP
jgi:bacillithiol synthase